MKKLCFVAVYSVFLLSSYSYAEKVTVVKNNMVKNIKTEKENKMENPVVEFKTSLGSMKIELWTDKAPITVKNFLDYVTSKHYDNTIFHRVIDGFVLQGGGFTAKMEQKSTQKPIINESSSDLPNLRGTLSMARTNDPNSATSQFFINLVNNASLNKSPGNPGYAVFGKIIDGMDVVDKMAKVKTGTSGPHRDVPVEQVFIQMASIIK